MTLILRIPCTVCNSLITLPVTPNYMQRPFICDSCKDKKKENVREAHSQA